MAQSAQKFDEGMMDKRKITTCSLCDKSDGEIIWTHFAKDVICDMCIEESHQNVLELSAKDEKQIQKDLREIHRIATDALAAVTTDESKKAAAEDGLQKEMFKIEQSQPFWQWLNNGLGYQMISEVFTDPAHFRGQFYGTFKDKLGCVRYHHLFEQYMLHGANAIEFWLLLDKDNRSLLVKHFCKR